MSGQGDQVDWNAYLDAISAMIGLPVAEAHRGGTIAHLQLNVAIVQPLFAFEVPEGTNPAPVFKP